MTQAEFDLGGVVGIRLLDAERADVDAVERQLGPVRRQLEREPDIEVRFVPKLETSRRLCLFDLGDSGFAEEDFFVFRRKGRARTAAAIPFGDVGGKCRITSETGASAVPFLVPIVNLTALAKGVVPLHASAFVHDRVGVLVTGWAKGGKTETLLAFMANGAQYVGDEWTYLTPDQDSVFGLPEPIKLWDWHLDDLPGYRAAVGRGDRARFGAIKAVARLHRALPAALETTAVARAVDRVLPAAERQLYVRIAPADLFGRAACAPAARVDKVILVVSHAAADIVVERIDPREIARRMPFSLEYERLEFLSSYLKFRFAFPERRNALIEDAQELEQTLLERRLAGKDAYVVYHPFPAPIPALFEAIRPLLGGS